MPYRVLAFVTSLRDKVPDCGASEKFYDWESARRLGVSLFLTLPNTMSITQSVSKGWFCRCRPDLVAWPRWLATVSLRTMQGRAGGISVVKLIHFYFVYLPHSVRFPVWCACGAIAENMLRCFNGSHAPSCQGTSLHHLPVRQGNSYI